MNPTGSHKDRHAKIGEGHIGLAAMENIINHPLLRKLPFYFETPNGRDIGTLGNDLHAESRPAVKST